MAKFDSVGEGSPSSLVLLPYLTQRVMATTAEYDKMSKEEKKEYDAQSREKEKGEQDGTRPKQCGGYLLT